jgi:5,10-methylene-tetrahydrofolate dehydrogenase/methenyl tetrahydrofolate cyclohydrolase
MQTTIINGRNIRNKILEDVKEGVKALSFQPVFCDVLVGNDPVSKQYIDMKAKTAESVGIHFHHAEFPESITTEELVEEN